MSSAADGVKVASYRAPGDVAGAVLPEVHVAGAKFAGEVVEVLVVAVVGRDGGAGLETDQLAVGGDVDAVADDLAKACRKYLPVARDEVLHRWPVALEGDKRAVEREVDGGVPELHSVQADDWGVGLAVVLPSGRPSLEVDGEEAPDIGVGSDDRCVTADRRVCQFASVRVAELGEQLGRSGTGVHAEYPEAFGSRVEVDARGEGPVCRQVMEEAGERQALALPVGEVEDRGGCGSGWLAVCVLQYQGGAVVAQQDAWLGTGETSDLGDFAIIQVEGDHLVSVVAGYHGGRDGAVGVHLKTVEAVVVSGRYGVEQQLVGDQRCRRLITLSGRGGGGGHRPAKCSDKGSGQRCDEQRGKRSLLVHETQILGEGNKNHGEWWIPHKVPV